MSLNDLINVSISATTVTPTEAGFGTPAAVAYHTHNTDRIRYYSSLAGLTSDGFGVNEPAYKMVAAAFAQSPAPSQVAVIRRTLPSLQVLKLTPTSATAGEVYALTFKDSAGVSHALTTVSTGVPATDLATILTAVSAFALAGCTSTSASGALVLTQTAGHFVDLQGLNLNGISGNPLFTFVDATTDPGIATDLAAALVADATGWYAFGIDSNSSAECVAAVAWAESNGKIFACNNSDTILGTAATTDLFSLTKTTADARSYIQASLGDGTVASTLQSYAGMAMLGNRLPDDPGSDTWSYKNLTGVPADKLTQTQINNIVAKNGNYYVAYKGVNVAIGGQSPSGEFLDTVRGLDWLTDLIQTDVFGAEIAAKKIPYTNFGRDQIENIIRGDLGQAVRVGFLNGGDATTAAPSVTAPDVSTQTASNRAKRIFPGFAFSATLAGAIHSLTIQGVVTA